MNLFEARVDWPILPTQHPLWKVEKTEIPPQIAVIPNAMVLPQNWRKCTWGLHCPICKKEVEDSTEDWKGNRQGDQPRNHHPQNAQHHQTYDVPD